MNFTEVCVIRGKSKYIVSKLDGNLYCKTNGKFEKHLRENGLTEEEYVIRFEGVKPGNCVCCGGPTTFVKSDWSFKKICGSIKCRKKHLSDNYSNLSELEKDEWSKRSKIAIDEMYASDRGDLIKNKISKKNCENAKENRAKRIESMKRKYGKEWYNSEKASLTKKEFSEEKKKDISFRANRTKEEIYGPSKMSPEGLENVKEKLSQNQEKISAVLIERYGHRCACLKPYSKISFELFSELAKEFDGCMFGENEWFINSKDGYFKYDFRHKNKLIEFNGDYWHANPKIYHEDDILNFPNNKEIPAKELWDRDKKKLDAATVSGFEVMTVWENEYRNNKIGLIEKLKTWLRQ